MQMFAIYILCQLKHPNAINNQNYKDIHPFPVHLFTLEHTNEDLATSSGANIDMMSTIMSLDKSKNADYYIVRY